MPRRMRALLGIKLDASVEVLQRLLKLLGCKRTIPELLCLNSPALPHMPSD